MKGKEFLLNHFYRFFCVVLLYCMTGFFVKEYYHFAIPDVVVLLLGALWTVVLQLFDRNKKTPIPYLILLILFAMLAVMSVKYHELIGQTMHTYYDWLWDMAYESKDIKISEGVALAYTLLSLCIVYLLCFPWYLVTKYRAGRFITAGAAVIAAVYCDLTGYEAGKITIAFLFTYVFLCLIELSFTLQYRVSAKRSQQTTTFLIPVAVILLLFGSILPSSSKPMRFQAIRTIWTQLKECGNQIAYEINLKFHPVATHEFGLTFAGFSEDGSISDNVNDNDEAALTVRDLSHKSTNLYLAGNRKNVFTEDGWSNHIKTDDVLARYPENVLQLYELMNAVFLSYDPVIQQDVLETRTLDVAYHDLTYKSVFCPVNIGGFESIRGIPGIVTKDDNLVFKERPKYKAEYKAEALELRLGTQSTDEFLIRMSSQKPDWSRYDSKVLSDQLNEMFKLEEVKEIPDIGKLLERRAQYIKENYTAIPENIPERVVRLADQVTKTGTSPYEKLKLLESYLSTFAYTTHPVKVPKGKEMLDYFLFESQEGYCTYFATAMTILSRCVGIPARFVQGYCIETEASDGEYEVSGNDAHAWVEAYLQGVGWITFEPTPGYYDYLYRSKETGSSSAVSTMQDYLNSLKNVQKETAPEVQMPEEEKTLTKGMTYAYSLMIIGGIVLLVIILSVGYLLLRIRYSRESYQKASMEEKLYILLQRILYLFNRYHICDEENPTLQRQFECALRVEGFNDKSTMDVAQYYMKLCYGDGMINEEEKESITEFYQKLLLYAKAQCKIYQYCFLLFHLARIKYKNEG